MKQIARAFLAIGLMVVATFFAVLAFVLWVEGVATIPDNAPPVQKALIGLFQWITSTNTVWVYVFYVAVLFVAIGVLLWHPEKGWFFWFQIDSEKTVFDNGRVNTKRHALEIVVSNSKDHIRTVIGPGEEIRVSLFVELRNVGNGFLSECYIRVQSVIPAPTQQFPDVALFPPTTILKGQKKFVYLVGFNETLTKSTNANDKNYDEFFMGYLNNPHFFGGHIKVDGSPVSQGHVFTIEAGSQDCETEKTLIRVWVEMPSRKLKAEIV